MSQLLHEGMSQPNVVQYLHRPRIEYLLKGALQKPLTTVVAGAGYGKSHAVSSVMESIGCKYAWLQLSELDNLIAVLWRRLVFVVAAHSSNLSMQLNALGYPDSSASFFQLLRLLEGELKLKKRFVLVLDDFHTIQDKTVLNFFEKIIAANVPNLSIVLISREKPKISLAGMLSKGLMARITEDDLRFTQDEMEAYYQMQNEKLDAETSSGLYEYTEGWILAIYLVGLARMRGNGHNHTSVLQAKIDIYELIEEEIFCAASKELQKFLIGISLLDVIPTGLLKELVADMPKILTEMMSLSLLIRYDAHSNCIRMHHLFKNFLSERKAALTSDEIAEMNLIAAQWFHKNNRLEEALNYYVKCDHFMEVFDIILSIRKYVAKDTANSFIMLIEQAPAEVIQARPIVRVVRARCMANNNRIQEAKDALSLLRAEYEALPPTEDCLAILGEIYMLLALISIVEQNYEFVALFKKADECLPDGSVLIDYEFNIAEGMNVTGIKDPAPGELKRYQAALFEAAPYAARVMNGCGYGMEYLNATDVAYMNGDIRAAEKYAYETVYRAQQQKQYGIEYMAYFYLIRIFIFKGDYTKIALLLKQMKEQLKRLQSADCMTIYDIIEGWFFTKVGQPAKVAKWIMCEEETRKMLAPVILGREYLVRSDCLLAEGKDYELLGFMKQSDVFYKKRGILYAQIQNRITESIIYYYLGNRKESMDALQTAYSLSHANNLLMQYIEYGNKMRTVVQAAAQDRDCKIPKAWLENIHIKSSTYAKRLAQVIKGYNAENLHDKRDQIHLSKRERDVLSSLCQGLTRDEIADAYNLSANTVKSILRSIFNKLGAINSLDAVRIAMMMNLV